MPPWFRRVSRAAALAALAPVLAGAHCNEDCTKPRTRLVARPMERTIFGPALLTLERVAPLAGALGSFDKRALRVDASRPVAIILAADDSWAELRRVDVAKLEVGAGGDSYRGLAVVGGAAKVSLFEGRAALADAGRAGWDAILLLPCDPGDAPWQAAVTVEVGNVVEQINDPKDGRCVDRTRETTPPPSFRLASLPLRCGDGVRQADEDCDDGDRTPGDGCSAYCTKER